MRPDEREGFLNQQDAIAQPFDGRGQDFDLLGKATLGSKLHDGLRISGRLRGCFLQEDKGVSMGSPEVGGILTLL
jgi:hypothetical protein